MRLIYLLTIVMIIFFLTGCGTMMSQDDIHKQIKWAKKYEKNKKEYEKLKKQGDTESAKKYEYDIKEYEDFISRGHYTGCEIPVTSVYSGTKFDLNLLFFPWLCTTSGESGLIFSRCCIPVLFPFVLADGRIPIFPVVNKI